MYLSDTIAAISTPIGEGGIAVIRMSGSDSLQIVNRIFVRKSCGDFKSHRFYYGHIAGPEQGHFIDEVMVVWMKAPNSFTREDVVEIQCHGGNLIVREILSLVLQLGARIADPGEFTKRAFLNGRIDLVQAEAVAALISSKTEASLDIARRHADGFLSDLFTSIRDNIRHALALTEAYVDFPDEDMGDSDASSFLSALSIASQTALSLVNSFNQGRVLRDGVSVLIAGKPNVGKSSLMNSLLNEKRSIVTPIPGTTRDFIEEGLNISGLPVRLLDTAGIRSSDDLVEQEGVVLTLDKIASADLILFLLDSSRDFDSDDLSAFRSVSNSNVIIVLNKSDLQCRVTLPAELDVFPHIPISASSGDGIDTLRHMIADTFLQGGAVDSREAVLLTNVRHRDTLASLVPILASVRERHPSPYPELLADDLRSALALLSQITGETTPDDILDIIFSQFCIGK